ncbi:ATP-binding protein [Streptomyces cirratus]|uniref:ATP-binding protein n=1 Tax=Streptomyces cirratus TaxID=68187 RepID=UPI0036133562
MVEPASKPSVLDVPAKIGALGEIAAFVLRLAGRAGLGKQATYRIRLAVDELATNIIMHGYRGGCGRITVRGRSGPGGVRIVLEDTAPPSTPSRAACPPPPGYHRSGGGSAGSASTWHSPAWTNTATRAWTAGTPAR